jgi:hypothetical protein
MSFEISLGRMSAATPNVFFVGERVELHPVMGFRAKAVVRRKEPCTVSNLWTWMSSIGQR